MTTETVSAVSAEDIAKAQDKLLDEIEDLQKTMGSLTSNVKGLTKGYDATFTSFITKVRRAREAGVTFAQIEARLENSKSAESRSWKASVGTLSTFDAAAAIIDLPGDIPEGWVFRPEEKFLPLPEGTSSIVRLVAGVIRPTDKEKAVIEEFNAEQRAVGGTVLNAYGKDVVGSIVRVSETKEDAIDALVAARKAITSTVEKIKQDQREAQRRAESHKPSTYQQALRAAEGTHAIVLNLNHHLNDLSLLLLEWEKEPDIDKTKQDQARFLRYELDAIVRILGDRKSYAESLRDLNCLA